VPLPTISLVLPAAPFGADLTHLHRNDPTTAADILAHGPVLHRRCLLIVSGNAGIRAPARNTFAGLRAWPKTCSDFCFGQAGFLIISERCSTMAGVDPFRPMPDLHITLQLAW